MVEYTKYENCEAITSSLKSLRIPGLMIVTRNADGMPYAILGEYLHDVVEDWKGQADACPANDERILFFMYNGEVVNPYEYTDFESVIKWMQAKLGSFSL